jgi:hypothetical protein
MDPVGLSILLRETEVDCRVILDAATKAGARLDDRGEGRLEACAFKLSQLYNVLEKILERICQGFENHFDQRGDCHEKLIQRLSLSLPGIRPAFIPKDAVSTVRELKGFRHVVRHAYDLDFREPRMHELVELAVHLARELPAWSVAFGDSVRLEQGWN